MQFILSYIIITAARNEIDRRYVLAYSVNCVKLVNDIGIKGHRPRRATSSDKNSIEFIVWAWQPLYRTVVTVVAEVVRRTPHCGRRISAGEFPCYANTVTVHQSGYRIFQLKNPFIPDPPYLRIASYKATFATMDFLNSRKTAKLEMTTHRCLIFT